MSKYFLAQQPQLNAAAAGKHLVPCFAAFLQDRIRDRRKHRNVCASSSETAKGAYVTTAVDAKCFLCFVLVQSFSRRVLVLILLIQYILVLTDVVVADRQP